MPRKQTMTITGVQSAGDDSSIRAMDREAYNLYSRVKLGTRPDTGVTEAFARYKASFIPGLLFKQLRGVRTMLEIGAGCGFPSIIMSDRVERAVLLDHNIDPVCGLTSARAIARSEHCPVTIVQGTYETAPFQPGCFDAVIAQSCIHHALHPPRVLQETFRLLRKGGRLVIIEPCRGSTVSESFAYRHYWNMPGMDPEHMHERIYTLSEWAGWLRDAGYHDIHVRTTYLTWAASFLARKGLRTAARLMQMFSRVVGIPYLLFAIRFGHPPLLPHQFTRKLTGFEYFEVMITARKP